MTYAEYVAGMAWPYFLMSIVVIGMVVYIIVSSSDHKKAKKYDLIEKIMHVRNRNNIIFVRSNCPPSTTTLNDGIAFGLISDVIYIDEPETQNINEYLSFNFDPENKEE